MLGNRKLILDTWCEVYDLLKPWADDIFWNFKQHLDQGQLVPGAVYLVGREQFMLNNEKLIELASNDIIKVIFSNPAEGSQTMVNHCRIYKFLPLVEQSKILLLVGGHVPEHLPHLYYENFLPKILDYDENVQAIQDYQQRFATQRPYKFLFLNGRSRWHRKWLLNRLEPLLDQAIWSNLDTNNGAIKLLDDKYEVPRFVKAMSLPESGCVKPDLFGQGIWGDIIMHAEPYLDTYFSLVTETVQAFPYSFRTEKIWKPVAIGHPWIVSANYGFYRDIRNIGFRTFGHLIDETFDQIENDQDRLERIATIVEDLCQQDLPAFLLAAQDICKYNQQLMHELRTQVRSEFPDRFFQFAHQYQLDE
jgi:hypothetical protein